eukprot:2883535-Lingulodinium_polyedra.AAC.1
MREPGGKKLSAEAWAAIQRTRVRTVSTGEPAIGRAAEPAAVGARAPASRNAAEPGGESAGVPAAAIADPRLVEARDWHRAAYEWRIVHFAMQAEARRGAKAAKQPLFLAQAVDRPALDIPASDYEAMLAEAN